mgnify:CR=1 FL=1
MQPVPYYTVAKNDLNLSLSPAELNTIVAMIYFASLLFLCQLTLAIHNIAVFVVKQKKYKTVLLPIFYGQVLLLTAMRLYASLFAFEAQKQLNIVEFIYIPLLNINLGIVQCLILFELSIRVK